MNFNLLNKIRERRFANSQKYLIDKKSTLFNAYKNKGIIFVHIPKTAGLSIIKSIFGNVYGSGHRTITFFKMVFGDEFNQFYKFSVIRNPYDRILSAYNFLKKGGINNTDKNNYNKYLKKFNSFEDFVLNGLNKKIMKNVIHFTPQYKFICIDEVIKVDFLIRFELLEEDLNIVSKKIGEEIILPHINSNMHNKTTKSLTNAVRKKIWKLYKLDFLIFNYSFDA